MFYGMPKRSCKTCGLKIRTFNHWSGAHHQKALAKRNALEAANKVQGS